MSYLEDGHTYVHVASVASAQYSTWVEELGDETQLLHSSWWPYQIIPLIMYYIYLNLFCITSFPILFYSTTTDYGFGYCLSALFLTNLWMASLDFASFILCGIRESLYHLSWRACFQSVLDPDGIFHAIFIFCYLDHNLAM